jgi:type IV secretory pathway protease TraF
LIKRLVGLPGEKFQVRDGEIWINGDIARKPFHLLRGMAIPVYDSDHVPKDSPKPFRWTSAKSSGWQPVNQGRRFQLKPNAAATNYDWLAYRHLVRDPAGGWKEDHLRDELAYNATAEGGRLIHDVLLECQVKVRGSGTLSLALTDGLDDVLIELPVGVKGTGRVTQADVRHGGRTGYPTTSCLEFVWPTDQEVQLTAGFVDRRVFVVLAGTVIVQGTLDVKGGEMGRERASLHRALVTGGTGPVSIGGRGIDIEVSHLQLLRDIHYTDGDGRETFPHGTQTPVSLDADQFFVLGDNTSSSYDSRCWKTGPAVRRDMLVGKAFFVHLPSRVVHGEFLGRGWTAQTPDWGRIHWIP